MKKILFTFLALGAWAGLQAQTKPAPKKTPAIAQSLKTQSDSLNYAIGLSLASFYKQQGITAINTNMVVKAINDVMKNGKRLLSEDQMNTCITNYMQQSKADKSAANRKTGEQFLAVNKTKPGVMTTASGLQYVVLKEGTGNKPAATDKVRVHYTGTLIDGTVFDSSVERGQPAEFQVNGVIPGWVEALQLMSVGSKWKLFLPSSLAYGDNQAGPKIPPGSVLVFEVELLDIIK